MDSLTKEEWLNRKEAALFVGTTTNSLSTGDSTQRHNLNPKKINGKIYYPKSVLRQYRDRNLMP